MKRASRRAPARIAANGSLVVAIDGGGTRTRCIVADVAGNVLGASEGGPANVVQCDSSEVKLRLNIGVRAALGGANVGAGRIVAVAAGLAGVLPDGSRGEFAVRRLRESLPGARIVVTGDPVIAMRGAIPDGVGVVVIAGTGSAVYGRAADGTWSRAGGGGALLGDDGSGYRLAVEGLRAAWRACDGRGAPTALGTALAHALKIASFEQAVEKVYGEAMTREAVAALGAVVAATAAKGDAAALEIVREGGRELGHAAALVARKIAPGGDCVVSYAGAALETGGPLLDALGDALRSACPSARLRAPVLPPLGGAFIVALEAAGLRAQPGALARMREGRTREQR